MHSRMPSRDFGLRDSGQGRRGSGYFGGMKPDDESAGSPARAPRSALGEVARFFHGSQDVGSIAITALFILGIIAFLRFAQAFLLPVVLAILFYFLLKPVLVTLCKCHLPRSVAAALVLAILIGAFVTAMLTLQDPAREFLSKAPDSVRRLELQVQEAIRKIEQLTGAQPDQPPAPERSERPAALRFNLAEALLSYTTLLNTATFLTGFLETIVLLFFLLAAGDRFLEALVRALPGQSSKDEAVAIVNDVQHTISKFMFSISVINACVGLLVAALMKLLGMPNPILWGVVAGVLNFMPYFGPLIVFTVLTLAGLLSFAGVGVALLPACAYLALHAIESNFITPAVLGRRLTINPLIIFLALMFWTWLWGIAGALLAVPLLMVFKILCDHTRPLAPVGEFLGQGQ